MAYTACVLEKDSVSILVAWMHANLEVPKHFEVICHHMTVDLLPICNSMAQDLNGQRHELKVVRVGRLDGVMAVEVDTDVPSRNVRKHITMCLDRANGWKPMRSNDITEWKEISPFSLWGVVGQEG